MAFALALVLAVVAAGLAACAAPQIPTDKRAYCEAHPSAILPDNTDCSTIANRTGEE
jgi:hypothetical protein